LALGWAPAWEMLCEFWAHHLYRMASPAKQWKRMKKEKNDKRRQWHTAASCPFHGFRSAFDIGRYEMGTKSSSWDFQRMI